MPKGLNVSTTVSARTKNNPIHILPPVEKVLEVIQSQNLENILAKNLCYCCSGCLQLKEKLIREILLLLFFFEIISHLNNRSILNFKLNYLGNRKQTSRCCNLLYGLLIQEYPKAVSQVHYYFCIYIKDIHFFVKCNFINLYADDIMVACSDLSLANAVERLNCTKFA